MPVFTVWDEINGDETEGTTYTASSAEEAALAYAEEDADGWTDGLYAIGQPICVREGVLGRLVRFEVAADMVPSFRAKEVTP